MGNTRPDTMPLDGISVIEIGERYGASLCGSFLCQLGADIFFIEGEESGGRMSKWPHRNILAAGKMRVDLGSVRDELADAIKTADIIIISSDIDSKPRQELLSNINTRTIICDVTAFGRTGPYAGKPYSDSMVQAVSGIMDVTGMPADGPAVSTLLLLESSAGLYAAAGTLAALRVRDQTGQGQRVDAALYDCAINFLTTFLPAHYGGEPPTRLGNGHSMVVPWNCYNTLDGRVQICSVTDRQWQHLCKSINRSDLETSAELAILAGRVGRRQYIDDAISAWTQITSTKDCVRILNAANIACGPVLPVSELEDDANLKHRGMVRSINVNGQALKIPASPFMGQQWTGRTPDSLAQPANGNHALGELSKRVAPPPKPGISNTANLPLAGVRVLEIGQFTTAPLAGKALGSMGAEIIKIEPPGGDAARQWSPHRHGLSYFFVFSNSDKLSIEIDLTSEQGKEDFRNLIASADILLENMKAGSLDRLGFSTKVLTEINPRIIYCPISGFGYNAVYAGRPAFDTVVQAMSGLMDMTHDQGMPIKCGASICDVSGGQLSLVAILAAIYHRDHTGHGNLFDLSMQDIGTYLTQTRWNQDVLPLGKAHKCLDGYVYAETLNELNDSDNMTCEKFIDSVKGQGVEAVRIMTISDVAISDQTRKRNLIFDSQEIDGKVWPLLNSPIGLSLTPTQVKCAIQEPVKISDHLRLRLGIPAAADPLT